MTTVEDKWAKPGAKSKNMEPCSIGCGRTFETVKERTVHEQQYHPREYKRLHIPAQNNKPSPPALVAETPGGSDNMSGRMGLILMIGGVLVVAIVVAVVFLVGGGGEGEPSPPSPTTVVVPEAPGPTAVVVPEGPTTVDVPIDVEGASD